MNTFDLVAYDKIKKISINVVLLMKANTNLPSDICKLIEDYSRLEIFSIYKHMLVSTINDTIRIYKVDPPDPGGGFDYAGYSYYADYCDKNKQTRKELIKTYYVKKIFNDWPFYALWNTSNIHTLSKIDNNRYVYISLEYMYEFKTKDEIKGYSTSNCTALGEIYAYLLDHKTYFRIIRFGEDVNITDATKEYKIDVTKEYKVFN